jgi:hypothetical protein
MTRQPTDLGPIVTRLGDVFVDLADTLASTSDYLDAMHNLTTMASSHESARLMQLVELQNERGPLADR